MLDFIGGIVVSFVVGLFVGHVWLVAEGRRERAARADLPHAMLVRRRGGRS